MIQYKQRDDGMYECLATYTHFSQRYTQWVTVREGDVSDGATGAFDVPSSAWWIHDALCARAKWDSGQPVTAWQAAQTLRDVLRGEGRLLRSWYWHWATFLFGCHKTRENGWF